MQNIGYDEFPGILDDVSGVFNSDTSLGNVYNSYLNIYDSYEEFNQKSGLSTNEVGLTFIAMEYLNTNTYDNHPSFDYRIEFSNSLFLDASNSDECLGLNGVWNETSNECYYSQGHQLYSQDVMKMFFRFCLLKYIMFLLESRLN